MGHETRRPAFSDYSDPAAHAQADNRGLHSRPVQFLHVHGFGRSRRHQFDAAQQRHQRRSGTALEKVASIEFVYALLFLLHKLSAILPATAGERHRKIIASCEQAGDNF